MDKERQTLVSYFEGIADPKLQQDIKELYQGWDHRRGAAITPAYVHASLDHSAYHGEDPHTAFARLVLYLHDELTRRVEEQIRIEMERPVSWMRVP